MNKCHLYKFTFTTVLESGKRMPNKTTILNKLNSSLKDLPYNPIVEYLGALSLQVEVQKNFCGKRILNWTLEVLGMLPMHEDSDTCEEDNQNEENKEIPSFVAMLIQDSSNAALQESSFAEDESFDKMVVPMFMNTLGQLVNPKEVKVTIKASSLTDELKAQVDNTNAYRRSNKSHQATKDNKAPQYTNNLVLHRNPSPKEAMNELQNMIGIIGVKQKLKEIFATVQVAAKRKQFGMEKMPIALHMLFTGNPGSAKTTVARLLGPILHGMGVLKRPKVVECTRADLVGQYVGWTAKNVKKMFFKARGGILFIDEAYSLVGNSEKDFGPEAITTIVSEMENHRDDVIVIFAGYPQKMEEFLNNNEGLRSRINFHLDFPDYSAEELTAILMLMANAHDYVLSQEAQDKCNKLFEKARKTENFGNGRFARNLLENAVLRHAVRVSGDDITPKDLTLLTEDDFQETHLNLPKQKKVNPIGIVA